ncbi:MAG: LysR family transcriptional regulator [Myxococcales bacterium]|nr:LysR family transcriptional regulator [Myxococcales bacterium]
MTLAGVDLNLLVPLRALLTHRSVTRAARAVGLSQSSMSHALARLRARLDDPLLVPVGRAMTLTPRARALIAPVEDAAARLEGVFTAATPFDPSRDSRTFVIAATDNLELYVLPTLARRLARVAPHVDLRVVPLPASWPEDLLRGTIDLKLGRAYPVASGLESADLGVEELACVVRRGHPIGPRPSLRAYAALGHVVVSPTATAAEPLGRTVVDEALAASGLSRRVALTVPHFLVAPHVVARTDLAFTGPARVLDAVRGELGLRRVRLPFPTRGYRLAQVWAAHHGRSPAHALLRGAVAGAFA